MLGLALREDRVMQLKEQDHSVLLEERQTTKREIAVAEGAPSLMAAAGATSARRLRVRRS